MGIYLTLENTRSVEGFQSSMHPPVVGTPTQQVWTVPYINSPSHPLPPWASQSQVALNNTLLVTQSNILAIINGDPYNTGYNQQVSSFFTNVNNAAGPTQTNGLNDSDLLDLIQSVANTNSAILFSNLQNLSVSSGSNTGPTGLNNGSTGPTGPTGLNNGPTGPTGLNNGSTGAIVIATGLMGPTGPMVISTGPTGPTGPTLTSISNSPGLMNPISTPGTLLLQSIIGSSPPLGITQAQIQALTKDWQTYNGIVGNMAMDPVLISAIESAYSTTSGQTVSQSVDAITLALRSYITSGQAANYKNPIPSPITDPTLLSLINDPSWISTANLPTWIVPGTSQSWMTNDQLSQFNIAQIKASTIPTMTNASDMLGMLLAVMRSSYIQYKVNIHQTATDSQSFNPVSYTHLTLPTNREV